MRKILNSIIAVFIITLPLVTISCSDDDDDKQVQVEISGLKVVNTTTDNTIHMITDDTKQVEIKLFPEDLIHDEYLFKYISSNDKVFTVDEQGLITAISPGEAVLRVYPEANTDVWTTCVVVVEERTYPITEIEVPEKYKDFFIGVGKELDLGALVKVNPENATIPNLVFTSSDDMIATIDELGVVRTNAVGDVTITIKAVDGSNVETKCIFKVRNIVYPDIDIDRSKWNVTISHRIVSEAAVNGNPSCLIDGIPNTCLVLVKPGKTFDGLTLAATDSVYFTVELDNDQSINYIKLRHRTTNTSSNLRVNKLAIEGSNDNKIFETILDDVSIDVAASTPEVIVDLPDTVTYKYLKVTMKGWASAGNTIQISEFNAGLFSFN